MGWRVYIFGYAGDWGGLVIIASGFRKLEMGKQGGEVSEIRMAPVLFMPRLSAT